MKQFFAALAMVSALLIVESRADESDKFCIYSKQEAIIVIESAVKEYGHKVMVLSGPKALAYYNDIRELAQGPVLSGIELIIVYNPGKAAAVFVFRGDHRCGYTTITWPLHQRAILAADRASF